MAAGSAAPFRNTGARIVRVCRGIAALALLCLSFGAHAALHVSVTTSADEFGAGAGCSLREALYAIGHASAFGGCTLGSGLFVDSISVPAGTYTITRVPVMGNQEAGGAFYVSKQVFISGAGAGKTILDGGLIDRVLDIEPAANGASVSVYSLSIRNGLTPFNGLHGSYGAGIYADFTGSMYVNGVVISDSGDDSGSASALFVQSATANVASTTVMRNRGIAAFLYHTAVSEFDNVTISGNTAYTYSAGLVVDNTSGLLTINNSTIVYNTGGNTDSVPGNDGGGLHVFSALVNVRNSIVARNSIGPRSGGADCYGVITSQGYNLIEDTGNCVISGSSVGNIVGVDPKLAPLFDYGSGVPTHLLLPGSPALDTGNPAAAGSGGSACLAVDARGASRTPSRCDMGAYEYGADFVVASTADAADANLGDGVCASTLPGSPCTLRAAIDEAGSGSAFRTIRVPFGSYALTLPTAGPTLASTHAVTLLGDGADRSSIVAQAQSSVPLSVLQPGVALLGMRMGGAGGALIVGNGSVLLDAMRMTGSSGLPAILLLECCASDLLMVDSSVDHNSADVVFGGGGMYVGSGSTATILNSTFAANRTLHDGGGIYNHGGSVAMAFTTIAGNTAHASAAGDVGGGGIARGGAGSFYVTNSIVANNIDTSGQGPDCAAIIQVTVGRTLLRDTTGCTMGGPPAYVWSGVDPELTSLAAQGGHTPTMGLSQTSRAHGLLTDSNDCVDARGVEVLTDQRGTVRPGAGITYGINDQWTCDLGAFQGVTDVIFADGLE